ncbi:hypothetical protein [Streptomyces litchfieldiae]|uniref:Uncharacterized protein n=1 Tax=Streptomyces litchfieldiae TaxID=3075543 RepID=A0ABU2MMM0_9ACTN|nr:hypothetical protein [Streptomyces sp. DSM 44938]MDT0342862.1 hypothetical protein [Streptomyces sp. DSM 44938]
MSHSNQYPQPSPQPPPYHYGGPSQSPGAYPGPPPGGHPPRGPKQSRALIAIVAVLAVLAAGVGAVLFLGGGGDGDGGGSGDEVQLTPHPTLEPMEFPDAQALDYAAGPDAACAAVSEIMVARNYEFQSARAKDGGIDCWYATPATSSIEDGTYHFSANVYMSVGDAAEPAYDAFFPGSNRFADLEYGPLYEFPVGEEGWIIHNRNLAAGMERGDGSASFRQGETTFYVLVYGWIVHPDGANEPLTEEVTFREITDIVKSLGGDDSAGEPQLSESAAQEYAGLEDFGEPMLPMEGSGEERCAAVTAAATEQLDVKVKGTTVDDGPETTIPSTSCVYEPSDAAYGIDNTGIRNIRVTVEDYSETDPDVMYPAGELGYDLRSTMDRLGEAEGAGPLYALPAGTSGYLIYEDDGGGHGQLDAGYVVGDYYISITYGGFFNAGDFNTRALTEEEMVNDLSLLLTAMNG